MEVISTSSRSGNAVKSIEFTTSRSKTRASLAWACLDPGSNPYIKKAYKRTAKNTLPQKLEDHCITSSLYHPSSNALFGLVWETSQHLATLVLVFQPNDIWETRAEILYWWRVTTQIWRVVLLIGWIKFPTRHDQSEALPRSGKWHVISMEFLRSFLRRHFAGKPVVASRNVGCFLRLNLGTRLAPSSLCPGHIVPGCLPFIKKKSGNLGWEFSDGKNGTCRLPFA